jgi:hypothetical protein
MRGAGRTKSTLLPMEFLTGSEIDLGMIARDIQSSVESL